MLAKIKRLFSPSTEIDEEKLYLASVLTVILVIVLAGLVVFIIVALTNEFTVGLLGALAAGLIALISLVLVRRGQLLWPSIFVPLVHLLLVTAIVIQGGGIHSYGLIGYSIVLVLAAMLLGRRGLVIFTFLVVITITGILYAEVNDILVTPYSEQTRWNNLIDILFVVVLLAVFLFALIGYLSASLNRARSNAQTLTEKNNELMAIQATLEQRVADRTQRLEIVAGLSERLSAILEINQLLDELVIHVKENLNYYHVQAYLLDNEGQKLVMTAGVGQAGAQMKAQGYHIQLNVPASLVARAARAGQIVWVSNVREAPDWLPNPLLPHTCSEMAVPIILDGQVVGVLDVQQDKIAGLDESDATLLRSVANQVAVAIRNARLFEEVETNLAEARELQRKYILDSWDLAQVAKLGAGQVKFSLGESTTLSDEVVVTARTQALARRQPAVINLQNAGGTGHTLDDDDFALEDMEETPAKANHALVAPIFLRDIPIGNLQLHDIEPNRKWGDGELALIEAIIVQVAQTAENLRLIDEAQERASRERLIGQISDRLRRASDMEALMKIAVEELSGVLKPARTFVKFGSETELGLVPENETPTTPTNGHGDNGHEQQYDS